MIVLKFSVEEVNLILSGLLELPARASMELILRLEKEAQKQVEEEKAEAKEEEEPVK